MPDPDYIKRIPIAYLAEYGEPPQTRVQDDRYTAFKFGYEAGQRQGREDTFDAVRIAVEREMRRL